MLQKSIEPPLAGTVLLSTKSPVAVEVMDADFEYSCAVIKALVKHAKDHGYDVDEVRIRFGTIIKIRNDGNRKADSKSQFRIIQIGEKLIAEYSTDSTML